MCAQERSNPTPGPWTIGGTDLVPAPNAGWRRVLLVNSAHYIVAQVLADDDDAEQAANARLIAAAPDMLDALRDIVRACNPEPGRYHFAPDELLYRARAILAQVDGKE